MKEVVDLKLFADMVVKLFFHENMTRKENSRQKRNDGKQLRG